MKENNKLANSICEFVKRSEKKGLVEIPLPTGFGKTHAVMQAISMMTERETGAFPGVKKIIFTTTLKKNLPVEKLKDYYKGDFDKEVLLLKSNVDSLIDFHANGGLSKIPWNKLPIDYTDDQRVRKIGNLLTKLRKKGGIYSDENRLWHLSEH